MNIYKTFIILSFFVGSIGNAQTNTNYGTESLNSNDSGTNNSAFNLSTFLASRNKKVILIGSDIRNPDLSKLFDKKSNSKGLSNIINDNKNDFKELFEKYKIKHNKLDTLF